MAKVSRSSGGGAWLKKDELTNNDILKLVSEATEVEGQNGMQLVAKCRVKGQTGDAVNLAINSASKNALIDAFGDDTKNWVNQELGVSVERGIFAGRRGIMLNLIPAGYEVATDAGGFIVIQKKGSQSEPVMPEYPKEEEINPEDIPF